MRKEKINYYFSQMILVTGSTGLVGSHLLYHLTLTEDKVVAIHRTSSNIDAVKRVFSYYLDNYEQQFLKIKWIEADICDIVSLEIAFKNIDYVYHCAAIISFDKRAYYNMRKINIEGTANMVNLAISHHIKKFCFVSSIATIEKNNLTSIVNSTKNNLISETNQWNKETNNYGYAITKYGAEMEVWRASQEGLDVVIVNPGVILGSGFWHNGPGELFTKFYNEFKFYTQGITGFVSVKDVVKAMILLLKSDIKNERFILVAENSSFKNLFFKIADAFNKNRPTIKVTKTLSNIAWRLEWLKSFITKKTPLITKHAASASLKKYKYTAHKIKNAIGFEFESLDQTVKSICNDFLKNH